MFKTDFQNYLNSSILKAASSLRYTVQDLAPSNEIDLHNEASLKIWSGASDNTIFNDKATNWAFRALHDAFHLKTDIGFSPESEILIGELQAQSIECKYLKALVEIEVSDQAAYYLSNGVFVTDQVLFTKNILKNNNLFKGLII